MKPSCTLFIWIFDGPGPWGAPILNVGDARGYAARTVARLCPSTVCRESENGIRNKQGPPFPVQNLFVHCCLFRSVRLEGHNNRQPKPTCKHMRAQPQRPAKNNCHSTATQLPLNCRSTASQLPLLFTEQNTCALEGVKVN